MYLTNPTNRRVLSGISGTTILELLIAVSLTLIISAAVVSAAHQSFRHQNSLTSGLWNKQTKDTIRETFKHAQENSRVRNAVLGMRVQPPGAILDLNGGTVRRGLSNTPPESTSTPLSFLALNRDWSLRVLSRKAKTSGKLSFDLCVDQALLPLAQLIAENHSNWLAFSPDGVVQLQGIVKAKATQKKKCPSRKLVRGTFALEKNPIVGELQEKPDRKAIARSAALIIPIDDIYSLYVSSTHDLRRVSHLSGDNQPVTYGVKSLLAVATPVGTGEKLGITIELQKTEQTKPKQEYFELAGAPLEGNLLTLF